MLVHSTDITIHAKSMQFHKKYTRKYSIWAPLEPSRGDQNESPSHLGTCRVPLPPKWVTRRCHSSRVTHVLCPLLGALLSQSASKDGPRFDKIGKVVHPSSQQTSFGKCWECHEILAPQNTKNMDSVREWKQSAHSCKSADQWQNTSTN